MCFGPRVREMSQQRQLTQRELEKQLGVSFTTSVEPDKNYRFPSRAKLTICVSSSALIEALRPDLAAS